MGEFYWHPCRTSASPLTQAKGTTLKPLAGSVPRPAAGVICEGEPTGRTGPRTSPMHIALYQPDIPQNAGTILRLAACLGIPAHLIEPAGFPVTDRAFRRAGMDYLDHVDLTRHVSWDAFAAWRREAGLRLVLFTTRAGTPYLEHRFGHDDVLMFGRESAGVPEAVHGAADVRLTIPIRPPLRSLNVAMACAMAVGEAMRQTNPPAEA